MIKINLATRKTIGSSSMTRGGETATGLSGIQINAATLRNLPIRKLVVPIVVCIGLQYGIDTYKTDELSKADEQIQKLEADKVRLAAQAGEMNKYIEIQKSLEADEKQLRTKIGVIKSLMENRTVVPRLLLELTKAIPEKAWLTQLKLDKDSMLLSGNASDFQLISDFMKTLSESAVFFREVKTEGTKEVRDPDGDTIKQFEISALRRIEP